ncbi:2-isopropylmalate synthase [Actinopolyspora lacussalsi subsp. righensis]|uniref:2-isopropylmalate synthase n=1 Tax=Actinopolyspora righensis TaxID=995060 RepID=A0A1I7CFU6_9ACTN|nr:2-isopropylmalate synthase [Actinopolyspora righensis]SFT98315.1 2-isopropylmalate synthase [Actinopolyspora righensis]
MVYPAETGKPEIPSMPIHKYRSYRPFMLPDRTWPDRKPQSAPIWCSVDLRDGNQALLEPMDLDRKRTMYDLLVRLGFKEIELGFPMSSRSDFEFTRDIIDRDAIPDDVTIQVMSPIREELIEDTVKALEGAPRAVLQIFNPTSVTQRRAVFQMSRSEIKNMALRGAETALRLRDSLPGTEIYLQYGTESFTQTEPEFALEVHNAVLDLWRPRPEEQVRVVLPSSVECYPPHEFADRIEWMHRNLAYRDAITLTLHTHNDRGSAVAATELALLAGADRVEGTLFGNGERAGNVCLITLAMNLFSQGIDPRLDLSDIDEARKITEYCNRLPVSHRHPWVGEFVYTSFAGSHQDAINKGLLDMQENSSQVWDVPYLPVDPKDVGRDYKALIRINGQSGKGGIAHLMRTEHGYEMPRKLQIEFASVVQEKVEHGGEVSSEQLSEWFSEEYLQVNGNEVEGTTEDCANSVLDDLTGAKDAASDVREVCFQPPTGSSGLWVAYAETTIGTTTRWGVGIGNSKDESLTRCMQSAARRLLEGSTA